MANRQLTIDLVTTKALAVIQNKTAFVPRINTQIQEQFGTDGAKIGTTVRIRLPDRMLVTQGPGLQVQGENEQYTTVSITSQPQVSIAFTSAETVLSLDEYEDRILKPRMSQLASTLDGLIAQNFVGVYNSVGTPGSGSLTNLNMMQAIQKMDELGSDGTDITLVLSPSANTSLVNNNTGLFNPQSGISEQNIEGLIVQNWMGYRDIIRSQSMIQNQKTGTRNTTGGTVATTSVNGDTSIALTGLGANATILAGEVFTVAGTNSINYQLRTSTGSLQCFVVTANTTASGGGAATVPVSPVIYDATQALGTVDVLPTATKAVVFFGAASSSYPQLLAFHENGFVLASAPLPMIHSAEACSVKEVDGFTIRTLKAFNPLNDQLITRVETLFGSGVLRPELAARIWL